MTDVSDAQVLDRYPGTWIDRDSVSLFRGFLEGRLLINKCHGCSRWYQPPWPVCPECLSEDVHPTEVSGRGEIFTFVVLHTGIASGVDYLAGHPVAVIELVEQPGLRISATVVGVEKEDLRIGTPVELTWVERNGSPLPAFRPIGGAA